MRPPGPREALHGATDRRIRELLDAWEPRVGAPTCRSGCFGCCRGLITVHSAEAPAMLRALADDGNLAAARTKWRRHNDELLDPDRTGFASWCPLLADGRCTVYAERPLVCRTQTVWHEAEHCGASGVDACVPAELIARRSEGLLEMSLAELDEGRWPFWGAISLVLELMVEHGEDHARGRNLSTDFPSDFSQNELLEAPPGDRDQARRWLIGHLEVHQRRAAEEAWPYGQPRAATAESRADLAPHIFGG